MSTDQPQGPDASNLEPQWLRWGKRLQSIAQNGLAHACDPYDRERYEEVRQVAAELMAAGGSRDVDEVLGLFIRQTGHATPKVDVRGAVFQRDSILLVQDRDDGLWALPGGWAETNESPSEAVEREVLEETGWVVRAGRLVAVYDYSKHPHRPPLPFHVYMLLFVCEVVEPGRLGPRDGPEISRVELFFAGDLPPLSPRRITPGQLDRLFHHLRTPGAPIHCD
jgi:ADP-ribose pyrophosphatase YjhB (NUDIX family)